MISVIVMRKEASPEETHQVMHTLEATGYTPHLTTGRNAVIVLVSGAYEELQSMLMMLPGIGRIIPVNNPYPLASREFNPVSTEVQIHNLVIGGSRPIIMAGPCSVETREHTLKIAALIKQAGGQILRGGAFKPRSSPYSFQGHGELGLQYLAEARDLTGLPIVSEVMEPGMVQMVCEYVDILQIGARNMQNYPLLRAVGNTNRPVLLKRGFANTIEEWLMSAEYIMAQGNPNVILCERGIRTFEKYTRNTLDLNAIPVVQHLSHLPVIVDPSHGVGHSGYVPAMARAGIAAGAQGLIVEVHDNPQKALSDGQQSLTIPEFKRLVTEAHRIWDAIHTPAPEAVIAQ
jgi:3-deoxy-7-phosphoheptulonate synthase